MAEARGRRAGVGLLLVTVAAAVGVILADRKGEAPAVLSPATQARPSGDAAVQDPEEQTDVLCAAYCSRSEPGLSVIEIRFPLPGEPAGRAARARDQAIDVSVYADGFDRQLFVRFPSLAPKTRPVAVAPPRGAVSGSPGMDRLMIADMATTDDGRRERLRLFAAGAAPESVVVQVTGLQPGLNYYWRVTPSPGGAPRIVMCRAAICPTDARR